MQVDLGFKMLFQESGSRKNHFKVQHLVANTTRVLFLGVLGYYQDITRKSKYKLTKDTARVFILLRFTQTNHVKNRIHIYKGVKSKMYAQEVSLKSPY